MENPSHDKPFSKNNKEWQKFEMLLDYRQSIWPVKDKDQKRQWPQLFFAVTRVYAALASLMIIAFLACAVYHFCRQPQLSNTQAGKELGERVVRQALATHFPDSTIVESFGPFAKSDETKVIQLLISLPTGERAITNWCLEGNGAVLETP